MRVLGLVRILIAAAVLASVLTLHLFVPLEVNSQNGPTLDNFLWLPFFQADDSQFTGYAFTNVSSETVQTSVEGLGNDGTLLMFPMNPGSEEISAQTQLARLGREFFGGLDSGEARNGWIRIASDSSELASFFLFGNGLGGPQTQLDGSVAFSGQSQVLFFTRLFDGPRTFRVYGGQFFQDAQTFLGIVNPNDEEITLALQLFDVSGLLRAQKTLTLPSLGMVCERVILIFDSLAPSTPIGNGYVRVDVTGPGAVGFELIQLEDSIMGLSASFGNDQNTLYSAQLANGTDQSGNSIFTRLKLVNTTIELRSVILKAFRDDGSEITTVGPIVLNRNSSFQLDAGDVFNLGSPTFNELTTGSIRVDVDGGPGVVGDVIFGDPGDVDTLTPDLVDFAAALSLQTDLFTRAIFSQVSNAPGDFTGLAIFNPNQATATVTIRVFDRNGILVGETEIMLLQNQRRSSLIDELVPATAGLVRGYIEIESDQPVVAQQLFGNTAQDFLAAVPPRILQ